MVPCREVFRHLPRVNSLFHLCLVLTLAWFLTGTGSPSQAEVPSEPSWPEIPQVSETAGAPQFLMVKQNSSGSSRYPIIVRDLRTWSTADGTRLVLDLNHTAAFTETHLRNPDRVVIDITNAILGKSSRQRVSGGTIPQSFHITQSRPRVVTITLTRTQGTKYKAFSLDNPDRLVIDIYHKAKDQIRQIGETASASPSASPSRSTSASAAAAPQKRAYFCTFPCYGDGGTNQCGENAVCQFDSSFQAYGCVPNSCISNLPAGCSL